MKNTGEYNFIRAIFEEIKDVLLLGMLPFIVLCVFSSTISIFAVEEEMEIELRILIILVGEALSVASLVVFGRQNGMTSYKKLDANNLKRSIGLKDDSLLYTTGEYAIYKGFLIGIVPALMFIVLQTINMFGDFSFVYFLLQYGCSWATAPLSLITNCPKGVLYVMVIVPILFHGLGYIWGGLIMKKRLEVERLARETIKGKKR